MKKKKTTPKPAHFILPNTKRGFLEEKIENEFINQFDRNGERAVAIAQLLSICFIMASHSLLFPHGDHEMEIVGAHSATWINSILGIIMVSSVVHFSATFLKPIRPLIFDSLNAIDMFAFVLLIWKTQQISLSLEGEAIHVPSYIWLMTLIALRILRLHPRSILVTGCAAITAWLSFIVLQEHDQNADHAIQFLSKSFNGDSIEIFAALFVLISAITILVYKIRKVITQLSCAFENMPHGVAMFDPDERIIAANNLFFETYGCNNDEIRPGMPVHEMFRICKQRKIFSRLWPWKADNDRELNDAGNTYFHTTQELSDGRALAIHLKALANGDTVLSSIDITQRHQLERRIKHMAYHDSLTGLANRTYLREYLEEIRDEHAIIKDAAVICLDLNHFKDINDSHGHYIGDALLQEVATRLTQFVGEHDLAARTGGDEFIIIKKNCGEQEAINALAGEIIEVLCTPYALHDREIIASICIGITCCKNRDTDTQTLLQQADLALYSAKQEGTQIYKMFEEQMNRNLKDRREMEHDLRIALTQSQFELYYQPVFNVARNEIASVEALIRWNHPTKGMIRPDHFIPLVDEIGLSVQLGEWVIKQACNDISHLPSNIKVAVNVSAGQFQRPGLVETVYGALARSGLAATRLEIEITETALLDDSQSTISTIDQLRSFGVSVAMDDFGTGYASLSYLQKFPFDRLKIDRSFVSEVENDHNAIQILRSAISLGKNLGIQTTAEGVETQAQFDIVKDEGCTDIQGYLISKPRPYSEIKNLLGSNTSENSDLVEKKWANLAQ